MGKPRISIVIPCYNAAGYLAATLDSIFGQTRPAAEVLVVDDGSTDDTSDVLHPYRGRIRYFHGPNHGAPARPRNIGIREAEGSLIAFFDADDLMCPGKIEAAEQVFEAHPEVDFLFTNFATCDDDGEQLDGDFLAGYQEFRRHLEPTTEPNLSLMAGADAYRCLLRANFIGTSSVVCRVEALHRAGPFDETMKNSADLDLWRRIAHGGHRFAFLDEVHHLYRIQTGSISHGGSRLFPAWIKGTQKQLALVTDPADTKYLHDKIYDLWLGYGYALRTEGRRGEAAAAYRTALRQRISWAGLKGLALSAITSRHT